MADITTGFGQVNIKADVLGTNKTRPGGNIGENIPSVDTRTPLQVGDGRLSSGNPFGQGTPSAGDTTPFVVGQVRPGGGFGEGTGAKGPSPKRTTVLD